MLFIILAIIIPAILYPIIVYRVPNKIRIVKNDLDEYRIQIQHRFWRIWCDGRSYSYEDTIYCDSIRGSRMYPYKSLDSAMKRVELHYKRLADLEARDNLTVVKTYSSSNKPSNIITELLKDTSDLTEEEITLLKSMETRLK